MGAFCAQGWSGVDLGGAAGGLVLKRVHPLNGAGAMVPTPLPTVGVDLSSCLRRGGGEGVGTIALDGPYLLPGEGNWRGKYLMRPTFKKKAPTP